MAKKFQMSDGSHGMLKGQAAPDAFQKVDPSMPKRSGYDTAHERQAVKPMKGTDSTGFMSQCKDISMETEMNRAIKDKLNQTMQQGMEDGIAAREDEEKKELTDAQIDEKEDKRGNDLDDIEALRARRRAQMKEAHEMKLKYQALGHGEYEEIEEEAFLKTVTSSQRCVVHFYHRHFEKCKLMDKHLAVCAKKFIGTKFVKLDAEKAPFFVDKLKIQILPSAVIFNDGVAVGRQLGFEGLGEECKSAMLAWRIKEYGGIEEGDFGPEDDF